ncbi:CocE/NonD family hydrolase [Prosthecomicrobium sp. N25]|uniref:CocE/NonD family hydrolase n=1 Tax=Prosthecomicrobium sp. N25 TaxID=3129254 RepID=UPI0030780727
MSRPQEAVLRLADGVRLVADVYRPEAPGRFPVLLMRQPYGRRIASTVVLAHPAWYAAHGYVVVVQDVRGRGDSEGRFAPLEAEEADGVATLDWAADLSGSDGRVATYGFSYQAMTQLLALAGAGRAGSKRPDAVVPIMGAWDVRDHWVFEGDAFRLGLNQLWAAQMAAEQARLAGDAEAHAALAAAAQQGMAGGLRPSRPDVLARHGTYGHYDAWLADDPALWARLSPARRLAGRRLDVPGLFVGGWLDIMVEGTLAMHRAFAAGPAPQRLVMTPWPHIPWGRRAAGTDLGPAAAFDVDRATIAVLDEALHGRPDPSPRVRLFDVGLRAWRGFDAWPETAPLTLHLASGGLAATTATDGALVPDPGVPAVDRIVHDPWRPAPAVGGALGTPTGYVDRAAVDDRSDVAVYTSAPLARPLTLCGAPEVALDLACDRLGHGLAAVLSIVHPDGRAIHLTDAYRRRAGPVESPLRLRLKTTFATVPPGCALRLSIQAAAWPAFAVEPGDGRDPAQATRADALVTTLAIRHGGAWPSTITLPILPGQEPA